MTAADPRLGQVFTPVPVADLALALALEGVSDRRRARVLDPACGDGVFLARAVAAGVGAAGVDGIDVDGAAVAAARARVRGVSVARGDFLAAAPPAAGREYDAVVGNPPYVRQELLGAGVKQRIVECMREDWPGLAAADAARFAGRADLATAFVARALRFTRPGGRVALVVSAALLDAGYGDALEPLLGGAGRIVAIVASPRERWFPDAAVHGVIVVLERAPGTAGETAAVRLRVPIAAAAARVRALADLTDPIASVRRAASPPAPGGWNALLRAPDAWWALASAAAPALTTLHQVAPVRRGATSGANEFFYLTRAAAAHARIEPRFLAPLLKTPRQSTTIRIAARSLPTVAFLCDLDEPALAPFPGARAWIRRHAHLASRPTLAARQRWWWLSVRPARLFLSKAYGARYVQHVTTAPVVPDQRVYALDVPPPLAVPLAAVLNGTATALALESLGRASLGEGVLEWPVADAQSLPILDPARVAAAPTWPAARRAFARLARRPIGSVFDEAEAADRRALDEALLAAAPPAARELLAAARAALVEAVSDRLARVRPARV